MISEQIQKWLLDKIFEEQVNKMDFSDLKADMEAMCDKAGVERAQEKLNGVTDKVFGSKNIFAKQMEQLRSHLGRFRDSLIDALGKAGQKTADNEAAMAAMVLGYLAKTVDVATCAAEVAGCLDNLHKQLKDEVGKASQSLKDVKRTDKGKVD